MASDLSFQTPYPKLSLNKTDPLSCQLGQVTKKNNINFSLCTGALLLPPKSHLDQPTLLPHNPVLLLAVSQG